MELNLVYLRRSAGIRLAAGRCPLYPQKQTCAVQLVMSALGQKRTFASDFKLTDTASTACHQKIPQLEYD